MQKWLPLAVLSLAQFLMVLDQAVMNVAISQLVKDFDTTVTAIQGVITFYALVMATLMMTGGKVGDIIGRRRALLVGLLIYGAGSALTAASWNVSSLVVGWSVLEGVGAALVLPALVALLAVNYEGRDRVTAFGVIGGVAGVGIAAGPIIGGFFTTQLSWRWVFVGEVIVAGIIVLTTRVIGDAKLERRRPDLDVVGSVLSAIGLGLIVFGMLQASSWGWLTPKQSPVEPFGFAFTPFVVLAGGVVLWVFVRWQHHRTQGRLDPLVRLQLLSIRPLRSGLGCFLSQNLVLLGIFFILPLYLQIVLGFDALETGVKMLPISIAMFITSSSGPMLAGRFGPKRVVQAGFAMLVLAAFWMLQVIQPELDGVGFAITLAALGVAMGLIASQLGSVVQSSVGAEDRGEAGGLQYTAQQLGSAIGTALIGAVVISSLVSAFVANISNEPIIPAELTTAIEIKVASGSSFVAADQVAAGLAAADVDHAQADAIVAEYREAQLAALKIGLLLAGFLSIASLAWTRALPGKDPDPAGATPVPASG
ncbi:MAG: MFS transporter [Actinomycetia bacterium]|nr:MFS transporter [Actinomycetes bacterium]